MKKVILSFLLFLVLGAMALAFTSESVVANNSNGTVDLVAGRNHVVGQVHVSNDDDYLYVTYEITEDNWVMTESHLYVGEKGDLPTNRGGNPVIGHFPYKEYFHPGVTEHTYEIEKDAFWLDKYEEESMIIAAHAVVKHQTKTAEEFTPTIYWTRSSEDDVFHTPNYGGEWSYNEVIGEFDDMTATVWDNGEYLFGHPESPVVDDVNYASWIYAYNNGESYANQSDLRLFRASFEIPNDVEIATATLGVVDYYDRIPINDNVYVYVNEELLFWGGTRADDIGTHNGMEGIQTKRHGAGELLESDRWYIEGTFPSIDNLTTGMNKIEVFTEENERWGGMGELILTVSGYRLGFDKSETAWGAGERITPRGNWATYFEYEWQELEKELELIEIIHVPSSGVIVYSEDFTEEGVEYVLKASGKYTFASSWLSSAGIADAKCSLRRPQNIPGGYGYDTSEPQWVDGAHLPGNVQYYLQIWVNGDSAGWEEDCNLDHEYTAYITGDGDKLSFQIKDDYYPDNSGSLTVEIWSY